MTSAPMIEEYLHRLALSEAKGVALVSELIEKHLARYAFSSLNALAGQPLSLQTDALFERLVVNQQGGYCFEHNKIAYLALKHLGFKVRSVLARVMLNGKPTNPRTHRMNVLELDGETYLVDVGFGNKTPRGLLNINQRTCTIGHDTYQITRNGDVVTVVLHEPDQLPLTLYEVELYDVVEADFEVAHFYSHQHPEAIFVNNLVVSLITASHRYLIRNQQFLVWDTAGHLITEKSIDSVEALTQLVHEVFLLQPPKAVLETAFAQVMANAAA
ncbi:arylamine N-acetyltransferase family protein [Salinivibrio proteolyticus]|uniref:Arylamine N-acetyltransferase n=1 Tax=Salinivibrio proteolyticus TaxID=334715 RepID=A0ABY7LBG5_9GAMM|nr:arylamine N-acetyltransferase [Salinivibrio proteolyticus]WBA13674.1 arylamine N-acetyltransferase [Salinivibrio proteolyticus]